MKSTSVAVYATSLNADTLALVEGIHLSVRPSWFCPNGKPDEGEYSHAENDNRNRDQFGGGKPLCHAPVFFGIPATALIWIMLKDGSIRRETAARIA